MLTSSTWISGNLGSQVPRFERRASARVRYGPTCASPRKPCHLIGLHLQWYIRVLNIRRGLRSFPMRIIGAVLGQRLKSSGRPSSPPSSKQAACGLRSLGAVSRHWQWHGSCLVSALSAINESSRRAVRCAWRGGKGKPTGNALHGRLHVSSFVVVMMPGQLGSSRTTLVPLAQQNSFEYPCNSPLASCRWHHEGDAIFCCKS